MNRRIFISAGLALVGFGRRVWAQLPISSTAIRYAPLTHIVRVPIASLKTLWQPVAFSAESTASGRRVLISGVVFRTETQLSALCVTCPHEQCQVDLVTEPGRLAKMIGDKAAHPLFECGCHFSVFDAAQDGARISGESPRGLYRFRINGIHDGMVEITDIEEVALVEV